MLWAVVFHEEFDPEFQLLAAEIQDELLAHAGLLAQFGPTLGQPRVVTLEGSRHANMKELRFDAADGVWRVAFAFDPARPTVVVVAGNKAGKHAPILQNADRKSPRSLRFVARKERDNGGKPPGQTGPATGRATRQGRGPRR